MAIYKISDLLDSLKSAMSDGFEYVEISEIDHDEDEDFDSNTLSLSYIESEISSEDDMIDAVTLPPNYVAPLK